MASCWATTPPNGGGTKNTPEGYETNPPNRWRVAGRAPFSSMARRSSRLFRFFSSASDGRQRPSPAPAPSPLPPRPSSPPHRHHTRHHNHYDRMANRIWRHSNCAPAVYFKACRHNHNQSDYDGSVCFLAAEITDGPSSGLRLKAFGGIQHQPNRSGYAVSGRILGAPKK